MTWNSRPHRPGDPRGHRTYRTWRDHMKATVEPVCVLCHQAIGDVPWPDPGAWTWHHDPTMEQLMLELPQQAWLAAAMNPAGGGPAHKRCNERGWEWPTPASHATNPRHLTGQATTLPTMQESCADCGLVPHLHRNRLGDGLHPSLDGAGRSRHW